MRAKLGSYTKKVWGIKNIMKARGAELYRQLHVPDFCREALHGMASRKRDASSQGTAEVKSRLTQYVFQAHHC